MFCKTPFVLLAMGLILFLFDSIVPIALKEIIYALSLSLKSFIVFVLPVLIFLLLFNTIAKLTNKATWLVFGILGAICCSNFLSTIISYHVGSFIYQFDLSLTVPLARNELIPTWEFQFPKLISNDYAMFAGILLGILMPRIFSHSVNFISAHCEKTVEVILKLFTYIIPLFICGYIIKLIHEKTLKSILYDYSFIFLVIAIAQFFYITFIYFLSNRFNRENTFRCVKNVLPAAITGFSTMSSAAAMPLSIIGAQKNLPHSTIGNLAIPITVNTHLIGDCFAIPIFAFAVLRNFDMPEPLFFAYVIFAFYFVLAKFSVAAIPGGGIIVMLPILESQFGFTTEMATLITALYILFDPVITCANVSGNGGFAIILDRIYSLLFRKRQNDLEVTVNESK